MLGLFPFPRARGLFVAACGLVFSASPMACLQISTGSDAGTDAGSSSTTGTTVVGTTATTTPTGTGCSQDPQTQVVLCEQISICPGVDVDPGVFPDCGFRIKTGSTTLDLECLCGTSVCPIGVPSSCADATQLLSAQNELIVCEELDEGRCIDLAPPTTGTSSSCDKTCESQCGGDPSCMQICGC